MKEMKCMKRKMMWMAAAIMMIGCTFALTACSNDDNSASAGTVSQQLDGVWYAEYEATGVKKGLLVNDENVKEYTYEYVIDSYRFNAETNTGMWTRYYMGTDNPEPSVPINLDGGSIDGVFTYTVDGNGKVSIRFDHDENAVAHDDQTVYFKNGVLTGNGINNESLTFEKGDEAMVKTFDEWNFMEHGGASTLDVSDRIYGVGYGYNFILDHSKAISGSPIIDPDSIKKRKLTAINGVDGNIHFETYTGHSQMEVANQFTSKADVSGGAFGFKGEVKAAFSASKNISTSTEYALTVVDVAMTTVELEGEIEQFKKCRTKWFRNAVEGEAPTYQGREGLFHLVNSFGTHLIMSARLGGRMRYANTVDLSKVSGQYDLTAFAQASFSKFSFSAKVSVDEKFKKSYETNKNHVNTVISVIGGTPEAVSDLVDKQDETTFSNWKKTLGQDNYKNTGVVEIVKTIPIWMLTNNNERKTQIQNYIQNGDYERDMAKMYDFREGVMAHIKSVKSLFTAADEASGTLIKNLEIDGDVVAIACQEFIPQLNASKRSIVLYPVVNNQPKLNLGYFIGSDSRYPQRVYWDSAHTEPTFLPMVREKNTGAKDELYILGCSFLHMDIDEATIKSGLAREVTSKGAFMEAKGLSGKGETDYVHKYPLVKIFNNIWTREDLSFEMDGVTKRSSDNQVYYNSKFMTEEYNRRSWPVGWTIPSDSTFHQLQKELENRNVQRPAIELAEGGKVGFNAKWSGWMLDDKVQEKGINTHFWACKKKPKSGYDVDYSSLYYFKFYREAGNVAVESHPSSNGNHYHSVRMIQKLSWK